MLHRRHINGSRPRTASLTDFARREDGAMLIFGLFIFVIILMVGGMAVDLMRMENQRVRLQSVSDRATLAAASLRQPLAARAVVERYFEVEGLSEYLDDVDPIESINYRSVTVRTRAVVPSFFLRMVGISDLPVSTLSTAEERFMKVEVSLVTDLSNSMNSSRRIQNLRTAGEDFIDQLFLNALEDQITVSVVPYTGQVNAGPELLGQLNTSFEQPYSHCIDFEAEDYETMTLDLSTTYVGTGQFDPWHADREPQMFFCPTRADDSAEIMLLSTDPVALRQRMRNLTADGNTSIEIGLKWGAALLDPALRPVVTALADDDVISEDVIGRPLDYDDVEALKVVVLMTDGENFEQWQLDDDYKTGPSGVWHTVSRTNAVNQELSQVLAQRLSFSDTRLQSAGDISGSGTRLSVRNPQPSWWTGNYYVPNSNGTYPTSGNWRNFPNGVDSDCTLYEPNAGRANRRTPFSMYVCSNVVAYELNYEQLWNELTVRFVANYLYHIPGMINYNTFVNSRLSRIPASEKNTNLTTMCNTLRDNGVIVYTIAFEAPAGGRTAMRNCAFSANHYFDVEGTDLTVALRAIAGDIQQLRLTQ